MVEARILCIDSIRIDSLRFFGKIPNGWKLAGLRRAAKKQRTAKQEKAITLHFCELFSLIAYQSASQTNQVRIPISLHSVGIL